ncbi:MULTISPECIES: hypothetical protein [unclassified Shinella]|jgi:hypothetical protein|uniref:hypothetical protein n=1 Tax=unclassified Shinella TaxID=2643062 RepID=UPI000AEE23E4|nr:MULTISPECIES: hypothetical protein [unclassified Shinella]
MTHDLVERLRKTGHTDYALMDEAADKLEAYMAENAALRAERDDIRKALEPFAKLAGRFMDETSRRLKPDDHNVWGYGDETLTYGDFRLAAAAIRNMGERT